MAAEWKDVAFSDAVVVNPGAPLVNGRDYPFIDMASVSAASRCVHATEVRPFTGGGSRFVHGDTLMARITPCLENGKIARFCGMDGQAAHGSTEFIVIRGRRGISDSGFAYYLTKWEGVSGYAINQMTGTSGRQRVPTDALGSLQISLPPLAEQHAIAHILGTLDDKIELNRRTGETLEAMARALFKSWFVDFDPVRAKLDGCWQRGQSLPGLPAHLYDLFPDRLTDSELGEIPEGWKPTTLESVVTLNPESWNATTRPAEIEYVDLSGVKWGRTETITHYTNADAPSRAQRVLRYGDTIVGTVRPGNGSYALVAEEGLTGSTGFAVLRPRVRVNTEFTYLAATDRDNIGTLSSLADGGAYPAVRPETVLATPTVCPPVPVMESFSQMARPWLAAFASGERESGTLTTLRDNLLPMLISGEVRVNVSQKEASA